MRNRIIGLIFVLIGLGCGWASTDGDRSEGDRQSAMPVLDSEPVSSVDQPNLNQQYAGWTFGRILGVSIGPKDAPPPPVFGSR